MIRYPIGQQNFKGIIEDGYAYVDKTGYIGRLLNRGKFFFLSRPRRFGKSLFLSTLECFFHGERELFKGLEIEGFDWDWANYPVLRFDFNGGDYSSAEGLDRLIDHSLGVMEAEFSIAGGDPDFGIRLKNLISAGKRRFGRNVVILVDEYEKPILDAVGNKELMGAHQNRLRSLYSLLKSEDENLKLVFMTGVTRFGQMSVFSGLNNLQDISLDDEFAEICGITGDEMLNNFMDGISELAREERISVEEAIRLLKVHYDGYHFSRNCKDLYNPMSLLSALAKRDILNYWFDTGTPRFLIESMKEAGFALPDLDELWVSPNELLQLNDRISNPIPLLYQTGYLTIKEYNFKTRRCKLGMPNREVSDAFINFLTPFYTAVNEVKREPTINRMIKALENGDAEGLMEEIQSFFAGHGYSLKGNFDREEHFQNVVYIILKLLSEHVETEYRTARGRIDLFIGSSKFVYVLEFKVDSSADGALKQIEERDYTLPFRKSGRSIIAIGIDFSTVKRTLDGWKIRKL